MKKINLSIIAILFATASVMATGKPVHHAKKAKQETCATCTKTKCTPDCAKKADCSAMSCSQK
jgi:hypothetical protein